MVSRGVAFDNGGSDGALTFFIMPMGAWSVYPIFNRGFVMLLSVANYAKTRRVRDISTCLSLDLLSHYTRTVVCQTHRGGLPERTAAGSYQLSFVTRCHASKFELLLPVKGLKFTHAYLSGFGA